MKKDERIRVIIKTLIEREDFVTVKELSDISHYSSRSIYTLLQSHEFLICLYGASIVKKTNKGIKIEATAKQKEKIYSYLNVKEESFYTDEKEEISLLIMLLINNRIYTIDDIASQLYRSKSSTYSILENAEKICSNYNCQLVRKTNQGIGISGKEENIRELFFRLIQEIKAKSIEDNHFNQRISSQFYSQMVSVFQRNFVQSIEEIAHNIEINLNTNFCDYDYGILVLRLAIFIQRTKQHAYILSKDELNNNIQEYYVALMAKMMIEQKFVYEIPMQEVYEIERMLLSIRKQINSPFIQCFDDVVIDSFLKMISENLNTDLTNDLELRTNLLNHLKPAIRRIKYGVSSDNPLMEKIREKYTEVYVAIITAIDHIEEKENVVFDANEIGYICLHIVASLNRSKKLHSVNTLLICDSGITFESYLKSSIESLYSEINIIKTGNFDYYKSIDSSTYDLILNASSYSITENGNILNIDQLFNDESESKIRHWLFFREFNDNSDLRNMFQDYLMYFQENSCKNAKDLINKYCEFLVNNGYVTEEYQKTVEERMRFSATAIGRGVVVTHGSKRYVNNSIILIIHLQNPIEWEHQPADLIIFAAIGNDVKKEYSGIFRKIIRIVSDDQKTYALKHCTNIEEIKKLLFG